MESTASSGIYYSLLARERVVLCDGGQEGFEKSSQDVLENTKPSVNMISYESNSHVYHILVSGQLRYVCVTDKVFDRQVAFAFLKELERQLVSTGLQERAEYVGPYALRQGFGSVMNAQLRKYSSCGDQLSRLQDRVNDLTGVMTKNIEEVVCRGENMEDLTDRCNLLARSCTDSRHDSSDKRRKIIFWKSVKMWVILTIVLVVILLIIAAVILIALAATGHFNKKS